MDFEYKIIYDNNITNIKIKKLNNFENQIKIICKDNTIIIDFSEKIVNIQDCDGEFKIKGNNSLIYFYLPITLNNKYDIINNKNSFKLVKMKEFFFIPNKTDCNSIDIFLHNNNFINNNESLFFEYYINYNIIPYSKNIQKNYIIFKKSAHINIPNYQQNFLDNEVYYIYFNFNESNINIEISITYENIIKLDKNNNNLIISSGINLLQLDKQENYYINIIKEIKSERLVYTILRNSFSNSKAENIILNSDNIYFNRTSYDEDIRIKIENKNDLFLSISSAPFFDLKMIIYDKNINIKKIKNLINIEFNTTNYESKLEYCIIINDNFSKTNLTEYLFHKIINDGSFIYKNIINSVGIEPISLNISINKFLYYNNSYTIIILGKENFGDTFHYIYYEPNEFNTTINKDEEEEITDENSDENEDKDKNKDNKEENDYSLILLIILIIIGITGLIALIITVFYCFRKKEDNQYDRLLNDINSSFYNLN